MSQPRTPHGRQSAFPDGLPTGTVTFLFTDIAGSTSLLARLGERYAEVLERHNEIIRDALRRHAGVEVNTEGDAFFAVFRSAPQAVSAAAEAQRQLQAESWPEGLSVAVRMGLHSGEGRLGGDNYSGLDVNRAARIAAAGHGGQVLLSDSTHALVSHEALDGLGYRDLGRHRLKDLPAPEPLWQLDVEGSAHEFPAIRSLDARPNNLPISPTTFVGREQELAEIRQLMAKTRLLTLTGVGGTGKTRLALAAAHLLLSDFADGCFFVPLQEATDPPAVMAAIASALGVREKPDRGLEEGVRSHLRGRQTLLVLDNFEQVLSASELVAQLLGEASGLRVIVTSRERLHLSAEQYFEVPPLRLPDRDRLPSLTGLSQYEAVALFIERATAARVDFRVTNENAPAVAEICARLDGLPLAIELAAARIRLLSPQAILDRLDRRLPLLTGGPRDAPARQRTLRDTIAWSHELLDEPERRLLERLSIFAGGWTLEAAEEVCNPAGELGIEALDGLSSLTDKSLIRPVETDGETRFDMLQVIREYAGEGLAERPEGEEVQRRHALHVLQLVERAEPQLVMADVRHWQRRLRREEDNIRAALRWAVAHGEAEIGMRLAGSVWRYWLYWARLREAREWLDAIMVLPGATEPTVARAKVLTALAGVLYWQGENERMAELYEAALGIYRKVGDESKVAEALHNSGWGALSRGEISHALELGTEALELYQRAGDEVAQVSLKAWLAGTAFFTGVGGQLDDTLAALHEAIEANRRAGRAPEAADWSGAIAQAQFVAGNFAEAADAARQALAGFRDIGNVGFYPMAIKAIAALELAAEGADHQRIVRLASAADRLFDELGGQLQLMERFGEPLKETQARMSAEAWSKARDEGRAMSTDEAVGYALNAASPATG